MSLILRQTIQDQSLKEKDNLPPLVFDDHSSSIRKHRKHHRKLDANISNSNLSHPLLPPPQAPPKSRRKRHRSHFHPQIPPNQLTSQVTISNSLSSLSPKYIPFQATNAGSSTTSPILQQNSLNFIQTSSFFVPPVSASSP